MNQEFNLSSVWITWERQTRNRSASAYLGIPLFEIIETSPYRILRYTKSILRTVKVLVENRPEIIFAQNPSIVLALLMVLIKKTIGTKIIIDAHNSGIHGPEENQALLKRMNTYVIKNANATIVTNNILEDYVNETGGRGIVLPDPLPHFQIKDNLATELNPNRLNALCITSWSADEPFTELLRATEDFADTVNFYFSGSYQKVKDLSSEKLPDNVKLLGFISEEAYFHYLSNVDFCVDLTTRSDCMVCGAYESIAFEKPILLSASEVQKSYFRDGALFCENDSTSISHSMFEMVQNIDAMKARATEFKQLILLRESDKKNELLKIFKNL